MPRHRKRRPALTLKIISKIARKARETGQRTEALDDRVPGLVVRATPAGTITFSFSYRCPKKRKQQRVTLGQLPADPRRHTEALADARARALALQAEVAARRDPRPQASSEHSLDDLITLYIDSEAKPSIKTWAQVERTLRNHLSGPLGVRPINEVQRRDLFNIIDELVARGKTGAAGNVRKSASRLFGFAVERDLLPASPAAGLRHKALRKRRSAGRDLSDAELTAVWRAIAEERTPWREYGWLLLLTGQRRAEVSDLAWHEVDENNRWWTIPASRYKTDIDHIVPFSDVAWKLLKDLPRWDACNWAFTLTGRSPLRGYGRFKDRVRSAANRHLGREMPPWRLHDLRVTMRTNLSRLGHRAEVAESVIGHVPPHLIQTYNKYTFLEERRDALQVWADHLLRLVERA